MSIFALCIEWASMAWLAQRHAHKTRSDSVIGMQPQVHAGACSIRQLLTRTTAHLHVALSVALCVRLSAAHKRSSVTARATPTQPSGFRPPPSIPTAQPRPPLPSCVRQPTAIPCQHVSYTRPRIDSHRGDVTPGGKCERTWCVTGARELIPGWEAGAYSRLGWQS